MEMDRMVEYHKFQNVMEDPLEHVRGKQVLQVEQSDVYSKMEVQKLPKKVIHEKITILDMSNVVEFLDE